MFDGMAKLHVPGLHHKGFHKWLFESLTGTCGRPCLRFINYPNRFDVFDIKSLYAA